LDSPDHPEAPPPEERRWLNRTVLSIGLASLFGDISYEMATAVLPVLVALIGAGPAVLGLVEGAADLFSSGAKLGAGMMGDRLRPRRVWGGAMYLVTGLATTAFAIIYRPIWLVVAKSVGWLGKGWRSPLKDALLADDTHARNYGKAYGFERMGDTTGAVLGPFLAVAIILLTGQVRHVFWYSLIPAVIAAGLLAFGAREHYLTQHAAKASPFQRWSELAPGFKRWLIAVGVFGSGDFSKTLLILWALGKSTLLEGPGPYSVRALLPLLLYAGYNIIGAVFAYLTGTLSDRIGRKWLLVGGYSAGVAAAVILALAPPLLPAMIAVFFLSGACVGTEEAIEKATGADYLAAHQRPLGFGVLATVNGVGDFVSSALVGMIWARSGPAPAFGFAAGIGLVGTVLLAALPSPPRADGPL
jgi:MFS family permease